MNKHNINNMRVATKEEILLMASDYNRTFSREVMEYINSLIGLETSILSKTECNEKTIELLTQTEFFRKIAIYNIFHRLVRLLDKEGINVSNRDNCLGGLFLRLPLNTFSNIFNFEFTSDGYSTIVLNETKVDESVRDKRLEWLRFHEKYERCRVEYNLSDLSQTLHISRIEREIKELEGRTVVDEKTKQVMEFQQRFSDAFLQDNGIDKDEFTEEIIELKDESPRMNKTLVKKYPHTIVAREIRYY